MPISSKIVAGDLADFLNISVQGLRQRAINADIKHEKLSNKLCFKHSSARQLLQLNLSPIKIATAVVKRGVGKTTITEAAAIRLSLYGLKVLCVDIDQQANLTKGLGMSDQAKSCPILIDLIEQKVIDIQESILNVSDGIDLLPSRLDNVALDNFMMVNRVNPQYFFPRLLGSVYNQYDVVLFDCPPTLGSSICAAMLESDLVICPLNPDIYSFEGIEIMFKEFENLHHQFNKIIDFKILLNRFDSKTFLSTDYVKNLISNEKYKDRLLQSVIRASQDFPNMKNKGKSVYDSLKKSTAKDDIDTLAREIISIMQEKTDKQGKAQ